MPVPVSLYINLAQNPAKIAIGPLLGDGTEWVSAPPASARTSGVVTTRLHFFDDSGTTDAPTRITVTAADIVFAVRKTPDAEDLIVLQTDWTEAGDEGGEYYEAEIDWNVVPGTWNKGETEATSPIADLIVDGRPVGIPLSLMRGAYDEGAAVTSPQLYVKTTADQGLTSQQKTNAQTNLGGTTVGRAMFTLANPSAVRWLRINADNTVTALDADGTRTALGAGTSSFDPASPGPIGETTPSTGKFSDVQLGVGGTDILIVTNVATQTVEYRGDHKFGLSTQTVIDSQGFITSPSITTPLVKAETAAGIALRDSAGSVIAVIGGDGSIVPVSGSFTTASITVGGQAISGTMGTLTIGGNLELGGDLDSPGSAATVASVATGSLGVTGSTALAGITEGVVAIGNSGTSKTLAITAGTTQTCTLTGNCTFTMPTATAGNSFTLFLNTGAGSLTGTFTGVKWAGSSTPTVTTTASRLDIFSFASDGTNWYGSALQNFTP